MNENENNTQIQIADVPYIVFEGELARAERHVKRLWIALIVVVSALLISNLAWLYYESQFETISYAQDGAGLNNINTGSQGDVYGSESENQTPEERQE
jgi:hypothetical protein